MTAAAHMEILPDHCAKPVVIFCCGNVLLGDDGFGPAVAGRINEQMHVPDWAVVIDVGTAIRELLFDIALCEPRPRRVVVIDAVDVGRRPGEVFEIAVDALPLVNRTNFSLHQAPTTNLLRELRDEAGVEVSVIACQVASLPDEVSQGLSPAVERAVGRAARRIAKTFLRSKDEATRGSTPKR